MTEAPKKGRDKQLKTILAVLIVTVVGLVVALTFQKTDVDTLTSESEAVKELLRGPDGVRGRACGILSARLAVETLGENELTNEFTNAPSETRVKKEQQDVFWSDSCRYISNLNSTVYVELYIETFNSPKSAELDLGESLPVVSIAEEPSELFDELYYGAGAWYARSGKLVIKVSLNDGKSGDLRDLSQEFFEYVTNELKV